MARRDGLVRVRKRPGLQLRSQTADATFNFKPPKDPKTGQPKQYTLAELTDAINETLLSKGYILVRGETTFRLWPSDTKIDPALVRRVHVDELKSLAVRDVVQTVLPLNALVAEDQVANVQKMMSKIGEVVALTGGRNALLMTDLAGNLSRIVDDLRSSEGVDGSQAETYSYVCQFVKARDAASQVREFLGAEPAQDQHRGQDGGRGFDRFNPGGFNPGGFDPRMMMDPRMMDPRMMMDPRGGGDPRRGGFGARGGKPIHIVHDDATNSVHVNAAADQVSRAKAFLTKIDIGKEKIIPGKAEWQSYPVPAGSAEAMAQALQDVYRVTSVRVRALSGNQIWVYATPADQLDIIEYINGYGKANKEITKTLSAGSMDLTDAVTLLKAMFPLPDKGGPFIDKHPNGNGIVVRGKPEQIADIEAVLGKGMGSSGTSDTATESDKVRILNLKDGSAAGPGRGDQAAHGGDGGAATQDQPSGRARGSAGAGWAADASDSATTGSQSGRRKEGGDRTGCDQDLRTWHPRPRPVEDAGDGWRTDRRPRRGEEEERQAPH